MDIERQPASSQWVALTTVAPLESADLLARIDRPARHPATTVFNSRLRMENDLAGSLRRIGSL